MTTCKFCGHMTDADPVCNAKQPPRGAFVCTREPLHDGDHVACGLTHAVETWPATGAAVHKFVPKGRA